MQIQNFLFHILLWNTFETLQQLLLTFHHEQVAVPSTRGLSLNMVFNQPYRGACVQKSCNHRVFPHLEEQDDIHDNNIMKHQNTEGNPTLSSSGIQDERRSCAECLHLRMTNLVNLFA